MPVSGAISQPNTVLNSLRNGVYSLQQVAYATDVPQEIASSTDTYMYIKTTPSEMLFAIDNAITIWYSRYNNLSWIKHGG